MEFGNVEKERPHTAGGGDTLAPSATVDNIYVNRDNTIAEGPLSRDQEMDRVHRLANKIGGKGELKNMLVYPNCKDLYEVIDVLNANEDYTGPTAGTFGHLYRDGTIAFVTKNGRYCAVPPGRYRLWNPRAEWAGAMDLGAGFSHARIGPNTVLRVPNGQYALCWEGTRPVVISAEGGGYFAVHSEFFYFERFVKMTQPNIDHGTYHIVRVPQGKVACVTESGLPYLLPYGVHIFDSLTFQFSRFAGLEEEQIKHGTLTRFIVKAGCLGLAWEEKTQPLFFNEPGVYFVDSAMFDYHGNVDISKKEIHLGSRKIITVHDGEVGISHDNGNLKVLMPGKHVIDNAGWLFDEFLSTQQQGLSLEREDQRDQMLVCETRELVRVGVQAYVFYHIEDPRLAVVKIGPRKNIERLINETATAVITTIIRSTSLAEISQGGKKEGVKTQAQKEEDAEKGDDFEPNLPFFDRVKDDFLDRLQASFKEDFGIVMLNIRIGDFKVLEREIAASIAKHALITAETQANLANLEGRRQIDLVNKDSDARLDRIQAEIEAYKFTSRNRAEALSLQETAQAKSEASRLEAEAEAESVKILAEAAEARANATRVEATAQAFSIEAIGQAKANATRLRGEAEADRAERLSKTTFGRDEAMALVKARVVKESLAGVEKTVYMPTELQNNPFSFFAEGGIGGRGKN